MSIHADVHPEVLEQRITHVTRKFKENVDETFNVVRMRNLLTYHEELHPYDVLDILESAADWTEKRP